MQDRQRKEKKMRNEVPHLTTEQRRENLEKANAARRHRKEVLDRVRAGEIGVPEVLGMADEDRSLSRLTVFTLVRALPGYGFSTGKRVLKQLGLSETKRIKGLGRLQRKSLASMFGGAE